VDKALLLAPRLAQDEVQVPGVGAVKVRGLTRAEVAKIGNRDGLEAERMAISLAMVDPVLTEDEVGQWQESAPAMEIQPVLVRINELSGLTKQAQKEAYKSV
jgi:hypothetical protein